MFFIHANAPPRRIVSGWEVKGAILERRGSSVAYEFAEDEVEAEGRGKGGRGVRRSGRVAGSYEGQLICFWWD